MAKTLFIHILLDTITPSLPWTSVCLVPFDFSRTTLDPLCCTSSNHLNLYFTVLNFNFSLHYLLLFYLRVCHGCLSQS